MTDEEKAMDRSFAYGLSTRASIASAASDLIQYLDLHLPSEAIHWTKENFETLDGFMRTKGDVLKSFHRYKDFEFLWDYIACDNRQGIYLVAESEQFTGTRDAEAFPLKHDFEKLLYVFAPLHLMLCKAPNAKEAARIADELCDYARKCGANFPAASVFVFYCRIPKAANVSYVWQAAGEPKPMTSEFIEFVRS